MKITKLISTFGILFLMLFAGCATGPRFSQISSLLPPIPAGEGRIYIYRTTTLGAAIQPEIHVNDQVVGSAKPRGFVYVDRPAGNYVISCSTEVERKLTLTLDAGQTRYVRLGASLGFMVGHIYPELVDPAEGSADLQKCHYIGSAVSAK